GRRRTIRISSRLNECCKSAVECRSGAGKERHGKGAGRFAATRETMLRARGQTRLPLPTKTSSPRECSAEDRSLSGACRRSAERGRLRRRLPANVRRAGAAVGDFL